MNYESLNIRTHADLAKLPWFETDKQGVRLRPGADVPPVIDMHTHLGFSFGFSSRIDHMARTPSVTYFRNFDKPFNFLDELFLFDPEESHDLEREMWFIMLKTPPRAHTHTLPNLIDEMDRCGVRRAVSLPIEIPFWPRHADHTLDSCRGQDRVIPFAGVHPWDIDPRRKLERQLARGARGLKYHPEFQFHPIDSPHALRLFSHCEELGVTVLSHSGSTGSEPQWIQRMSALPRFRAVFKRCPNLRFILGHCGLRNVDDAIAYNREFPNVWLETSGQPVPILKKIFRQADTDRVLFGSDWAFSTIPLALSRALLATEDNHVLRQKFLSGNAQKALAMIP